MLRGTYWCCSSSHKRGSAIVAAHRAVPQLWCEVCKQKRRRKATALLRPSSHCSLQPTLLGVLRWCTTHQKCGREVAAVSACTGDCARVVHTTIASRSLLTAAGAPCGIVQVAQLASEQCAWNRYRYVLSTVNPSLLTAAASPFPLCKWCSCGRRCALGTAAAKACANTHTVVSR